MKRDGTVLLLVVVIVMLLSLAAYNYMLSMQTEHIATVVVGERLAARQAAYSARDLLAVLLEKSRAERDEWGGLSDNVKLFGGQVAGLSQAGELTMEEMPTTIGLIAYPIDVRGEAEPARPLSSLPADENPTTLQLQRATASGMESLGKPTRYGAVNESSKLHLFKLLESELSEPGSAVEKLMSLPEMDEATAQSLLDWMDADDQPRPRGAESSFYATLTRPLVPRNGLPLDLDELLFVKGVTPQRLFGDPAPLPDPTTPEISPPTLDVVGQNPLCWGDLLTVYSAERNETYTGQPRVFLNALDLAQLHQDLAEVIPLEWATFIVLYRQYGHSSAPSAQKDNSEPVTIDFTVPAQFEIESPLDLIGISVTLTDRRRADNDDEEVTVESPFSSDLTSMQSQLPQFLDAVTLVPENRVMGRVNINEAPPEVLSTLPGLDAETVEAIVAARQTELNEVSSRSHPIWLMVEGIVTMDVMRELLPHVTCGGDVYRASVWGRLDATSPLFHFETVLDASEGVARSVYYRELAAPKKGIRIPTTESSGQPIAAQALRPPR